MVTLQITKRGSVTIPPDLRKRLGLDHIKNPLVVVEERDGGLFLQPAAAVPIRSFPRTTIDGWIRADEAEMAALKTEGKD